MARKPKLTARKKDKFCQILMQTGNISKSAVAVDLSRTAIYKARDACKVFARQWDDAFETFLDNREQECARRAFDGVDEPIYYKGDVCGHVKKFSDILSMFYLKAYRDKFKERHILKNDEKNPLTLHIHTGVKQPNESK